MDQRNFFKLLGMITFTLFFVELVLFHVPNILIFLKCCSVIGKTNVHKYYHDIFNNVTNICSIASHYSGKNKLIVPFPFLCAPF